MRMRIDELARRAGVTSRNIRAYQARGLLPPPELQGRTGFYGEAHLRRLELVRDLQKRGFSLEAIRHTLDAWSRGGDWAQLVGIPNILATPFSEERPASFTFDELVARFPEAAERPELVARALDLGLVVADGERFVAPSPTLIEAGAQLVAAGIPLDAVLDVVTQIRPRVAEVARVFIGLVADHLVTPVLDGPADPADLEAVVGAVNHLRPIALEVVRPFLAQELSAATREAIAAHGFELEGST